MNTDTHYIIGKSHIVCEDYALSGMHRGTHYVILSDGCSAETNVDVGARILCHTTEKLVKSPLFNLIENDFMTLNTLILDKAKLACNLLGLPYSILHATLIMTIADSQTTKVFMFGDGAFAYKTKSNDIVKTVVSYDVNAPWYPYYSDHINQYFNSDIKVQIKTITNNEKSIANFDVCELKNNVTIFTLDSNELDCLMITSDGVESYIKDNEFVSTIDMLDEYVDFKSFTGSFVQRRLKAIERKDKKENRFHDDDVSIGAINYKH